jgi:hypothetical protein
MMAIIIAGALPIALLRRKAIPEDIGQVPARPILYSPRTRIS